MNRSAWIIVVIVVVAVGVGVLLVYKPNNPSSQNTSSGSNTTNNTPTDTSTNNQTPAATNKVTIQDFSFSPTTLTVKKGTTVTWTNNDSAPHTVTADSGNGPSSDTLQSGQTYSFTFNDAGTFAYHCNFHSSMRGTVVVQ